MVVMTEIKKGESNAFAILNDPKLAGVPRVVLFDCFTPDHIWNWKVRSLEPGSEGVLTLGPSSSTSSRESASPSCVPPSRKRKRNSGGDADVYEVEKILDYALDRKKRQPIYFLKWVGYAKRSSTWVPGKDLIKCNKLLVKFFEANRYASRHAAVLRMDRELRQGREWTKLCHRFPAGKLTAEKARQFADRAEVALWKIFTKDFERFHVKIREDYKCLLKILVGMRSKYPDWPLDKALVERAQNLALVLDVCAKRRMQLRRLEEAERKINLLEACRVVVVNERDLTSLPEFVYVNQVVAGEGILIPHDPLLGCRCAECGPGSKCCGNDMSWGYEFAYDRAGRLKLSQCSHIFECGPKCSCPPSCPNRVIQRGRTKRLAIVKTDARGWGVETLEDIREGEFVCEYVGMLVRESEGASARSRYAFALDYNPDMKAPYCLDAGHCGNLARFINHSCNPNLTVRPFWVDCLERDMPRLAFFAQRDIQEGEELGLDYENLRDQCVAGKDEEAVPAQPSGPKPKEPCLCREPNCRNWLFSRSCGKC